MKEKHFIDTSVLRPILISPPGVKEYYKSKLSGDKYICDYVNMEFLRGYIKSAINFYLLLSMSQYDSFSAALNVWANKFEIRKVKNIQQMVSNLIEANECFDDKEKSKRVLADYIRRLIGKLHTGFKKIEHDSTYCTKGKIDLNYDPKNIKECFLSFEEALSDNNQYKQCNISDFIKDQYRKEIHEIVEKADDVSGSHSRNKDGFNKIVEKLKELSEKKNGITCAFCANLGDVVISLLSDPEWTLEHTDYSFDHLCEILNKKHRRHPNDTKIINGPI